MPRLRSWSYAHPAVPADERAQLAQSLPVIVDGSTFLLATCLRVEMVSLTQAGSLPSFAGRVPASGLRRDGQDAFHHLCRVAAGLESPLVGEPEVLGQFRRALTRYRQAPSPDPSLVRILESVVGVARRTRRLLADEPRGSLAAVAARIALPYPRVAILGAGAMARATSEGLGDKEVAVFARRSVKVGHRQVWAWDEAERALRSYPVVISTYPGKTAMPQAFRDALRERAKPLLLIDLGMPPAFAPGDDLVRYLGIDELAAAADAHPSAAVDVKLKEDSRKNWQRLETPARTSEVIAALTAAADQAADEEFARFARRLRSAGDPERLLRQLARTVARRVVHPPISYLGSSPAEAVEVVADAFGVKSE